MLRRRFFVGATALVAAVFTAMAHADDLVVKIGFAAPLTGSAAGYGKDLEDGVRLALEDAKAKGIKIGGKSVTWQLVPEDDQGDPRVGVQIAQKLVDSGVNVVIGHFNSGVTIPASMMYNAAGLPMIAPASTNPTITARGLENVYAVIATDAQLCGNAGTYAVKVTGAKRIAVMDDRTAFGQGETESFIKAVVAAGGSIVAKEYTTDKAIDFKTQLTNIKGANADLIFFGGMDTQGGLIAKQLKQLDMQTQYVGGGTVDSEFLKIAGDAAEGAMAWQYGVPPDKIAAGRDFAQRFRNRFGIDALSFAPNAYDATWVAIKAMQEAGSAAPADYRPFLKKTDFEGATGRIAFNCDGSLKGGAATLFVVKNGTWVPVVTRTGAN